MEFIEHYRNTDYYRLGDDRQRLWRDSGAAEKAANIVEIWPVSEASPTVVDIGFGDGAIAAELSRRRFFESLEGFDVSGPGVEIAKQRIIPRATFSTYDGSRIPVDDATYDLAILSHVVEHVEEPRALLREAARVARWLVVEVPLERNAKLRGDFTWTDTGHVNFYDPVLIRQLIQSCGLVVVDERVTSPGRVWARATHNRAATAKWAIKQSILGAARPLATALFTYHGVVLARGAGR